MAIKKFSFNEKIYLKSGRIFPPEIEGKKWIFYHGTSSLAEDTIDSKGLFWQENGIGKQEVEAVIKIFDEMGWCGISHGGYPILVPYTLNYDFGGNSTKPIYLAEDSQRAITFSSLEFSGGETYRAIRKCIEDLKRYRDDSSLQLEHKEKEEKRFDMYEKFIGEGKVGEENKRLLQLSGVKTVDVDLGWLDRKLKSIQYISDLCFQSLEDYKYGLVYAVSLDPNDLEGTTYHNCMGIRCHKPIPNSAIVAKSIIPKDTDVPMFPPNDDKNFNKTIRTAEMFKSLDLLE